VTSLHVRRTDAVTVRPLRHEVLRFGLPVEESVYEQDDLPETVHLAASGGAEIVGVATVFPEAYEGRAAWRLRGMAVAEPVRGSGVGSALLAEVVEVVRRHDGGLLWCNARSAALPFYLAHGFTVVGEEFLAAHGIPHRVALLDLQARRVSP
jgi:predicted GNAT family N-acyltransferase